MRKIFFVVIGLVFIQNNVSGQVGFQTFLNYNSVSDRANEFATDFVEIKDNSFFVPFYCANAYQVDTLGYAKTYFAYSIISEMGKVTDTFRFARKGHFLHARLVCFFGDSASFLIAGYITNFAKLVNDTIGTDLFLVKVNLQDDTLWSKTVSFSEGDELPSKLIKTRDGGFAVIGQSCDKLETNCDMFLLKLDSNANEEWHRTYAWDDQSWELPNSMHETSSGEFILTSMMFPIGTRNFYGFILKVGADGELLWKLRPDKQNNQYSTIQDVVEDPLTGQYYFCGAIGESEIKPYHYQGWLIKTDTAGNILKEKKIGESTKETYFHKMLFDRGHLVLNGESNNFPGFIENLRPLLYKTDSNFNILFARAITDSLNPTQTYIIYNLKPTADGGFGMIGFGDDPKRVGNNQDVWFLQVDSNGCLYQPCLSVGLEQHAPNEEFKVAIFPQPAKENFQLETAFDYDQIELVHMNGVSIGIWGRQEVYLLPAIPTGVYLLRLSNKFGTKLSRKILVQEN